jgi:hypothetical protein
MTNEAVLYFETAPAIPMTCSNTTGIERGTILKLADPLTVSICSTATAEIVAGIAAEEKIASDGHTKVGVYRHGVFKVIASGSITAGDALGTVGDGSNNYVYSLNGLQSSSIAFSGSRVLGIALETAADEETFLMELNIGCIVASS